jgi:hypothetical protein
MPGARRTRSLVRKVWVGDTDHFKIFDRRSRWFSERDPEGVAFGCPVLAHDLARKQRRWTLAPQLALIGRSRPIFDDK